MFPIKQRKEVRVAVRVTERLRARIDSTVEKTGIPEPVVVVKCLEAYCDYVEQHGEATFPLIVKPKSAEASTQEPKRKTA